MREIKGVTLLIFLAILSTVIYSLDIDLITPADTDTLYSDNLDFTKNVDFLCNINSTLPLINVSLFLNTTGAWQVNDSIDLSNMPNQSLTDNGLLTIVDAIQNVCMNDDCDSYGANNTLDANTETVSRTAAEVNITDPYIITFDLKDSYRINKFDINNRWSMSHCTNFSIYASTDDVFYNLIGNYAGSNDQTLSFPETVGRYFRYECIESTGIQISEFEIFGRIYRLYEYNATFSVSEIQQGNYKWSCVGHDNTTSQVSEERTFTILANPNVSISDIKEMYVTNESVELYFESNYWTNYTIHIGSSIYSNSTFSSTHTVIINDLNPETLYFYNITYCDNNSNCFTSETYNVSTVSFNFRRDHPRLLLNQENLEIIRAKIQVPGSEANADFADLVDNANDYYDDTLGTGFYDYPENHIFVLSFIYVIGNISGFSYDYNISAYGEQAIEWIKVYSNHFYTDGPSNSWAASEVYAMSMGYDWIHPLLTQEDMEYILPRLISSSEQMHTNDCKYWFSDYTLGCYTLTATGMAAYGDDVYLNFTVQWNHYSNPPPYTYDGYANDKMLEYLELFVSQYINESYRMWQFASQGGGSFQSMIGHSGDVLMLLEMLDPWYTATGQTYNFDLNFIESWPEWWTYGTVPYLKNMPTTQSVAGDSMVGSDNKDAASDFIPLKTHSAALAMKRTTTIPGLEDEAALFQWFNDYHLYAQYTANYYQKIFSIIWYNESVVAKSPEELNLPLTRLFGTRDTGDQTNQTVHPGGTGIVIMKSAWEDPNATLTVFKSRPFIYLHQDMDSNSFTIHRKGNLAIDSGKYINGDWNFHERNYDYRSIAHNVMNIYDPNEQFWASTNLCSNDAGQRIPEGNGERLVDNYLVNTSYDLGGLTRYESREGVYDYMEGDATRAYHSTLWTEYGNEPKVSLVKRQFVYLRSDDAENDFIVVFDKVNATNASFTKSFLIHSKFYPDINGSVTGGAVQNDYLGTPGTYFSGNKFSTYDKAGRLYVNTLLPKNHTYKVIGGPSATGNVTEDDSYEFYVDGTQYDIDPEYTFQEFRAEVGSWRVEVECDDEVNYDTMLHVMSPRDLEGTIIDNDDPEFSTTGSWSTAYSGLEYYKDDYLVGIEGNGATATWSPDLTGNHEVYIMWNEKYECNNVPFTVNYNGGSQTIYINQSDVYEGILAGDWFSLGTFSLDSASNVTTNTNGDCGGNRVSVDAVRFRDVRDDTYMNMPNMTLIEGTTLQGVFINNTWAVMFGQNPNPINYSEYTIDTDGLIKHLVVDLIPGALYEVYSDVTLLDTTTASDEGTLYFNTTSTGVKTFTITTDGLIPVYHDADTNEDGSISTSEMRSYMLQWKNGAITISDVVSGLAIWKG